MKKGRFFFILIVLACAVIGGREYMRQQEMRMLRAAQRAPERKVTLVEGWTIAEMDEYLAKEGVFSRGAFTDAVEAVRKNCRGEAESLKFKAESCELVAAIPQKVVTLEGYLFPDTYRLYLDARPEDLVEKMLDNFQAKISDQPVQKALRDSGYTLHEAVSMASIVEAEVPHAADRPVVAGILWKRIDAGMALQVDSTVNYVTGKGARSVSLDDTKTDSPYNTYRYPGLPPGPIGNPGLEAILAALKPKASVYWYFLSAKDGRTIFSRTLEEHVAAKRKYLR